MKIGFVVRVIYYTYSGIPRDVACVWSYIQDTCTYGYRGFRAVEPEPRRCLEAIPNCQSNDIAKMGVLSTFLGLLYQIVTVTAGSLADIEHVIIFMQENRSWNSVGDDDVL